MHFAAAAAAAMTSLTDTIRTQASQLKNNGGTSGQRVLDESAASFLEKAEDILGENCAVYGDETTQAVFSKFEASLRTLMKAGAMHKAQEAALSAVASKIDENASPADVQAAFSAALKQAKEATDEAALEENYEPLKKLRKLRDSSRARGGGGAGPSGTAADDDDVLGEDGVMMTQEQRPTKCVLLQVEMASSGELRPVKAPCGHCFSYKGIKEFFGRKAGAQPCPVMGCNRSFTFSQVVDDKEMIKLLKAKERQRLD